MTMTDQFERGIAPFFWVDHEESASACLNVGEYGGGTIIDRKSVV